MSTLQEQLEAKKAAAAEAAEVKAEVKVAEVKKPLAEGKKFRVGSFAFQFRTGNRVLKADKFGVYTPEDADEKAYLEHQVKVGNILFN